MQNFNYTELEKKSWSSDILGYVAQIHEYKGRQDIFLENKPTQVERLVEIAKIQSTEASNKIEGIITTNARIKQLCAEKTMPRNRDEEEIVGYRDVLNTIYENYPYMDLKASVILQLHRDLYRYSAKSIGGRFKNTQNYITETRPDGTEFVRFTPLPPFETPEAMDKICESYKVALDRSEIDPLILIPAFIVDFLCIHPFNDGNGRMSRLLTTLLLTQRGYGIGRFISLESKIEKTKASYYDALEESSANWHEGANDPTPFVRYILSVILAAYRDFEERVDVVSAKRSSSVEVVKKAIDGVIGKFTKTELMERCPGIGKASIEKALKMFTESGYIIRHGGSRSTFYTKK